MAGLQAKASTLQLRDMIEDRYQHQHEKIAVSLTDDLVGAVGEHPLLAVVAPASSASTPAIAAVERYRKLQELSPVAVSI